MRILIRTSKWAIWARRLASFAVPLAVIPVILHRQQVITTEAFHTMALVALIVAGLSLFLSLGALVRLWITGDRGWDRAFGGLLLSLLCLAPFVYGFVEASRYPRVTDVSTSPDLKLALLAPAPGVDPTVDQAAIEAAFPNAHTRTYPLDAPRLYEVVSKLVSDWGWDVRLRQAPPTARGTGQIDAVVTTWLGWRDAVAIRVSTGTEGGVVDMRSASLTPSLSDLGANGKRIEEFLLALDSAVTTVLRNSVLAPAPQGAEGDTPPPVQGGRSDVVVPADRPADLRPPPPEPFDTEAPPQE